MATKRMAVNRGLPVLREENISASTSKMDAARNTHYGLFRSPKANRFRTPDSKGEVHHFTGAESFLIVLLTREA